MNTFLYTKELRRKYICIQKTLVTSFFFYRAHQLFRSRSNVQSLFSDVAQNRQTMVEKAHHTVAVVPICHDPLPLLSVDLGGLRVSFMARCHFCTAKSLHDHNVFGFLLQDLHETT